MSFDEVSIAVESRFKNMINIDTAFHVTQCDLDKKRGVMIFRTNDNALVKNGANQYIVSFKPEHFTSVSNKNKKYSAYESDFKYYPFVETEEFFEDLERKIDKQSKILESDSTYLLLIGNKTISFRKSDNSIKKITETIYDHINKGFQFQETSFGKNVFDSTSNENIKYVLSIINNSFKKIDNTKEEPMPNFIDKKVLFEKLNEVINGKIDLNKKIFIFLDFFFQGCLPCVESYPYINSLYNSNNSSLAVIGVDQIASDSSTINKYIEKYNLQYPILIGQSAVFLTQYFKLHSFPFFIVLDHEGNVLNSENGFTKSSFKKITKKFLQ